MFSDLHHLNQIASIRSTTILEHFPGDFEFSKITGCDTPGMCANDGITFQGVRVLLQQYWTVDCPLMVHVTKVVWIESNQVFTLTILPKHPQIGICLLILTHDFISIRKLLTIRCFLLQTSNLRFSEWQRTHGKFLLRHRLFQPMQYHRCGVSAWCRFSFVKFTSDWILGLRSRDCMDDMD